MKLTTVFIACLLVLATAVLGQIPHGPGACSSAYIEGCQYGYPGYCEGYYWDNADDGNFSCVVQNNECVRGAPCEPLNPGNKEVPEFGTTAVIVLIAVAAVAGFLVLRKR